MKRVRGNRNFNWVINKMTLVATRTHLVCRCGWLHFRRTPTFTPELFPPEAGMKPERPLRSQDSRTGWLYTDRSPVYRNTFPFNV